MSGKFSKKIIFTLLFTGVGVFLFGEYFVNSASTGQVVARVSVTVCGNGVREAAEECDNSDLAGKSCSTFGFNQGTLLCRPDCVFDKTGCSTSAGGGGGAPTISNSITISGRAFPLSKISVLRDGQLAISTISGPDAKFSVALAGLSPGSFNIVVYGEDASGKRSASFSFKVTVTSGTITNIGGVFISPTIDANKYEVKKGDNLVLFGKSVPFGEITINVNSENNLFFKTKSDKDGAYLQNLDTTVLEIGSHSAKSKAAIESEISNFGKPVAFKVAMEVGEEKEGAKALMKGDLNADGRVNLVDFSIAAFWYKRTLSAPFLVKEKERLNGDGKLNLVDFSIMAYYWTG